VIQEAVRAKQLKRYNTEIHEYYVWQAFDTGRSIAGFWSKKPLGFKVKPILATGITGQSSRLGIW